MDAPVDLTQLDAFVADVGDAQFAADTVRLYLDALDERIAAIVAGLRERDRDVVTATAHTLGSTSALLGAAALAALCRRLERDARSGDVDTPGAVGAESQLLAAAAQTRSGLAGWLGR